MYRRLLVLSLALGSLACADEPPLDPNPNLGESAVGDSAALTIRLRVHGGGSPCATMPDSSGFVITVSVDSPRVDGVMPLYCPEGEVTIDLQEGLLVELNAYAQIPGVDLTYHSSTVLIGGDTTIVLTLAGGQPVGGIATMDGVAISIPESLGFLAVGEFGVQTLAGLADSDSAGLWIDRESGQPFRLQNGRDYIRVCLDGYGMRYVDNPPFTPRKFTRAWSSIDCAFESSRKRRHTHFTENFQVTAEPGVFDPYVYAGGRGYGMAFPTGGSPDYRTNHIHYGTLLVSGADSATIYTAPTGGWVTGCPNEGPCPTIDPVGNVRVADDNGHLRVRYDMVASDSNRFAIRQTSWTGANGDYVLYNFVLTNLTGQARTFYFAWHLDWDVNDNLANFGGTSLSGRLMYAHDFGQQWYGSYIITPAPVEANWADNFGGLGGVFDDALAVMRGDTISDSYDGDVSNTHGTSMFVSAGGHQSVWFAIVAGSSLAALENNARLARDEARERRRGTFTGAPAGTAREPGETELEPATRERRPGLSLQIPRLTRKQ